MSLHDRGPISLPFAAHTSVTYDVCAYHELVDITSPGNPVRTANEVCTDPSFSANRVIRSITLVRARPDPVPDPSRDPAPFLSRSPVSVPEGGSSTVTVRLDRQPAGNLTINITKPGGGPVLASPSSLTFSTTNWNTPRTVTLHGPGEQSGIQDRPDTLFHFTVAGTGISSVLRAIITDTAPGAAERVRIRILTEQLWNEYFGTDSTHPGPPRIESVTRTSGGEHTSKSVLGFNVTFSKPVFLDPGDLDVPGLHGEWFRVERRIEHYDERRRGIRNGEPFYKPCNSDSNRIMLTVGVIPGWDLLNRIDNECWRRKDMSRHWFVLTSAWASTAVVGLVPHAGHDIEDAWGNRLAWGPATWPTGDDYQLYLKGGATRPETGPGSPAAPPVWTATLTVGEGTIIGDYGYAETATGALQPAKFSTPGGVEITVSNITWNEVPGYTTLTTNVELPTGYDSWFLHIGADKQSLDGAAIFGSGPGARSYTWTSFFTGTIPTGGVCDVYITTDGIDPGGSCRAAGASGGSGTSGPSGTQAPQPQVLQPIVLPFAATVSVDKTVVPVGRGIDAACSPQGSYREPHTYAWRAVQNAWDSAARTYDNNLPPVDTGSFRHTDRPVARWTALRPARAGIEGPVRLSCVVTDASGAQATVDAPPIVVYIPGTPVPDPFPGTWTTVAGTEAPEPQAPEPVTGPGGQEGPDGIEPQRVTVSSPVDGDSLGGN
ncbi:MAG: hypothetical protein OXP66_08650, partial [Candidatus Tectomicrobia bacterium]|nr:hypothetical protein [Candidatus Tectomicrobia bacterium]